MLVLLSKFESNLGLSKASIAPNYGRSSCPSVWHISKTNHSSYKRSTCLLDLSRPISNLGPIREVAKFPVNQMSHYGRESDVESSRTFSYFIVGTSMASLATIGKNVVMPLLSSMGAARDVMAQSNLEIDVSSIREGEAVTFKFRGKPLFVRHRTSAEIEAATSVPLSELPDPELDEARYRGEAKWLLLIGICTHLGCVPLNKQGLYDGWFCPCHGSHYDTSGRIRAGPAPKNMEVPPYHFLGDTQILVGLNSG